MVLVLGGMVLSLGVPDVGVAAGGGGGGAGPDFGGGGV